MENNTTGTFLACPSCGANVHFPNHVISDKCSYCGSTLINKNSSDYQMPDHIVPFELSQESTRNIFQGWIKNLWFAPNELKYFVNSINELKACNVPFWSFSANVQANYSGERGSHYYERHTKIVNDRQVQTKERRTRWHHVSGSVQYSFNHHLELAQTILPNSLVDDLGGWDLSKCKKFDPNNIIGSQSLFANISLDSAWNNFVNYANQKIAIKIKQDIGGDEQRILSKNMDIFNKQCTQIAVPIWIGTYKLNNKTYRVCINGQNGKVDAERPYSWLKIGSLITAIGLSIAGIVIATNPQYLAKIKILLGI